MTLMSLCSSRARAANPGPSPCSCWLREADRALARTTRAVPRRAALHQDRRMGPWGRWVGVRAVLEVIKIAKLGGPDGPRGGRGRAGGGRGLDAACGLGMGGPGVGRDGCVRARCGRAGRLWVGRLGAGVRDRRVATCAGGRVRCGQVCWSGKLPTGCGADPDRGRRTEPARNRTFDSSSAVDSGGKCHTDVVQWAPPNREGEVSGRRPTMTTKPLRPGVGGMPSRGTPYAS